CFMLARGRYFRWAAYDDVCAPEYLARCVEFLDSHPEAVLVYPETIIIDEKGRQSHRYDDGIDLTSSRPSERLANLLRRPNQRCNAAYGMIRSDVLRRTSLMGAYASSDQNMLAELALLGHLRQIPAPLFFRRDHPQTCVRAARS